MPRTQEVLSKTHGMDGCSGWAAVIAGTLGPVQAVIPTGAGCHLDTRALAAGTGQGWGRGGQDVSPWAGRSAEPVLMLSGRRGVILHLCGPAVGAGHKETSRREEDFRSGARGSLE